VIRLGGTCKGPSARCMALGATALLAMGGKGAQAANAKASAPASHAARRVRRGVQSKEYLDMDLLMRLVSGWLPFVSAYS
jgi:hypothetical protein